MVCIIYLSNYYLYVWTVKTFEYNAIQKFHCSVCFNHPNIVKPFGRCSKESGLAGH